MPTLLAFTIGLVTGLLIPVAIIELHWKRHWILLFVPKAATEKGGSR